MNEGSSGSGRATSPADYGIIDAVDIGGGIWVSPFLVDSDGNAIGLCWWHDCATNFVAGSVRFDNEAARRAWPRGPYWTLVSREPLTVSPSILCRTCGRHGFVQNGRWVSA